MRIFKDKEALSIGGRLNKVTVLEGENERHNV
jgi:hypothetical protein